MSTEAQAKIDTVSRDRLYHERTMETTKPTDAESKEEVDEKIAGTVIADRTAYGT
jgi:hypothetical protein